MRIRTPLLALALVISACATDTFTPPPISPLLIARAQSDQVTVQQLSDGRTLFLHRCLECHTLPSVTAYQRDEWPQLVQRMAARADLTAAEEQSVTAYLRAASTSYREPSRGTPPRKF